MVVQFEFDGGGGDYGFWLQCVDVDGVFFEFFVYFQGKYVYVVFGDCVGVVLGELFVGQVDWW